MTIFTVYSLVVTLATYAGDPIDCKTNAANVDNADNTFDKFLDK